MWMQLWCKPAGRLRAPRTLILSEDNIAAPLHDLGWGELIEAVTVMHAPGDHNSMLSITHRHVVVKALQAALESAES
jgi:thioesterase domain-containing protein